MSVLTDADICVNVPLDRFNPAIFIDGLDRATDQAKDHIRSLFAAADERAKLLVAADKDLAAREKKLAEDRAALEADRQKHEERAKNTNGLAALASNRMAEIKQLRDTQDKLLKEIDRLKEENKNLRGAILALSGQSPEPEPASAPKKVKQPVAAPVS